MISDSESNNPNSKIQNITYKDPNLGIKLEYPISWKPIERILDSSHVNIIEFVPVVEVEHHPPTPFFNILIENVKDTEMPTRAKLELLEDLGDNGISYDALETLIEREIIRLADIYPEFNIVKSNETFLLSDIPAHKIVYTFADPGSPLHPIYEGMRIWALKEGKVYTISYLADESAFLNHLQTTHSMIDSFEIVR